MIAKIRYKEWNERKAEEARHKKMVERMERQRVKMEEQEERQARAQRIRQMKKRSGAGGQILLAYGMNKNLKQLGARASSARGARPHH